MAKKTPKFRKTAALTRASGTSGRHGELKGSLKGFRSPSRVRNSVGAAGGSITDLAAQLSGSSFTPDADTSIQTLAGMDAAGGVSLARRVAAISRWRDYYDPLIAFNAARARTLAEDYTRGWFADLQWTYFYLEWTNPDLFALVDRRSSRLLEMDITTVVEKEADKTLAQEQAAMIDERIGKIGNLDEAIEHLSLASFRGYSHLEKWYNQAGDLEHLECVDQWNVVRDGLRGGWKYNPRAWQTGYQGLSDDLIIDPRNFIIRECRRHINRIALLQETSRRLTSTDWDAFNEIYGIPSGVIIAPPGVTTDKLETFLGAAEEIARGGTGALPNGSLYEPNDFPRSGSPFKERLEYLTEKLLLVGTGGLLTMAARSGSGTLAGNAHAEVFEQLAKADAQRISRLLNRSLVFDWLARNFPGKPRAARCLLAANEETKVGEVVAHVTELKASGYQTSAEEVSERTGYAVELVATGGDAKPIADALDGGGSDPETGDSRSVANRKKIRNIRRLVDVSRTVFDRNATRQLSQADTEAVRPLLDRIASWRELGADAFLAELKKFSADLPRLLAEARLHAPDITAVWDDVLGTALLDGLTDLPALKK